MPDLTLTPDWFTEAFETANVQEAKALREELNFDPLPDGSRGAEV